MVVLLQKIARQDGPGHPFFGTRRAEMLRRHLAKAPADDPAARFPLLCDLGLEELRMGNEREAIALLDEAAKSLPTVLKTVGPKAANNALLLLGIAWMRLAETENCCNRNTPESCIVPIRGEGIHTQREGATQAARWFREILVRPRADRNQRLTALWLSTVAAMTLGAYPDGVDAAYRIPPEAFEPEVDFPRFPNVAQRLGLDTFSLAGGAVADDLDGDDRIDLVVSTWDLNGQMRYFHNEGNGTFAERTEEAGLSGLVSGLNMVQADYDNDGWVDILVLRGAWNGLRGRHPNSLLRNTGGGFVDVTFEAGLADVHWPTQAAGWADYDLDGDLDVYVGNESTPELHAPSQLFRNEGNGTFTDVAREAGVTNDRMAKGVGWGDYDADRDPDLYVSNLGAANRLYRNDRGTFTDVAEAAGVTLPKVGFATWFWDYDNDGILDIFAANYTGYVWEVAAHEMGLPVQAELDRLYRGRGDGTFEDVAEQVGLVAPTLPMGCNFGDLDNDGWLDFYLGTGNPDYISLTPNVMYRNREGRRFVDVSAAGGFAHLQKGHAVAFADFDQDGDLDVFEQMGGANPGDAFYDVFYENPGFGAHWLGVQLVGVKSNRSAIGAVLRADFDDGGTRRSVHRVVNSGGSFGANPLRQTLGLGAAGVVQTLEVRWPATGRTQTFHDVPVDRVIRIREGADAWETLDLRPTPFAGRPASPTAS
jgi:hypothetical protein